MKTLYEVLNIDLADQHTKARKLSVLDSMGLTGDLLDNVTDAIEEMDIPADDERHHWIQKLGRASGVDLLTIGKVQPENMIAMAGLGDDFTEAVKVATSTARKLNQKTIDAERDLNKDMIPDNTDLE
jgi:hypothetical protein|tara:strand:+ start:692 stop:1072 length:381 start_codon:yes stop_codon:yes gene_type:complete